VAAARAAEEAAAAWELDAERAREAGQLVARLVASDLFARSAAAARRFAELPVLFRDTAGFLVEGKIDLLFEEGPGLVVVDYKTDRDLQKRMPEYEAQLADYTAAIGAIGLSQPVVAAYLLSARDGRAIEMK
jgi:ATP-dependent exoDNAse (exonuclease V) beta subunit